jgi:hypothetical protein
MANTMSKSELIQRIMDAHHNEIARKDVKLVSSFLPNEANDPAEFTDENGGGQGVSFRTPGAD